MKVFARTVWLFAILINLGMAIIDLISGAWIMAILSLLIICIIAVFGIKIKLWTKEPWVINER